MATELLRFRRDGQLLLVDGYAIRPLLVRRGGHEVEALLAEVDRTRDVPAVLAAGVEAGLLRALLNHGIIVDAMQPRPPGRRRRPGDLQQSRGMSLYLLLAQDCNLGCVYCLNGESTYHRADAPRMSEEIALRAVEMCFERMRPGGMLQIVLFGGEPLLNWPLAKAVMDQVEADLGPKYPDRAVHFHLTSNLAKLPSDLLERIERHKMTVLCDIDGPPELHDKTRPFRDGRGSCARITANVRRLVGAGVQVALRATVTSRNVDRMVDIARYHKEIGGSSTAMVAVNAVNSDEQMLGADLLPDPERFAQGLCDILDESGWPIERIFPFNMMQGRIRPGARSTIACGAPHGNTPVVDTNGDIYACIYLVGMPAYRTGNVFDPAGFPDRDVVEHMTEVLHVDNLPECRDCSYRYVCVGGCPVGHLLVTGSRDAGEYARAYHKDMRCRTTQTVVEEILWRVAERASAQAAGDPQPQPALCG